MAQLAVQRESPGEPDLVDGAGGGQDLVFFDISEKDVWPPAEAYRPVFEKSFTQVTICL